MITLYFYNFSLVHYYFYSCDDIERQDYVFMERQMTPNYDDNMKVKEDDIKVQVDCVKVHNLFLHLFIFNIHCKSDNNSNI